MKRLILITGIAVMVFFCSITAYAASASNASRWEVNKETGQVRLAVQDNWGSLTTEEEEAVNSPGKEIPVCSVTSVKRINFFYVVPISRCSGAVIYDGGEIRRIKKEVIVYGEKNIAIYVVFLFVAAACMVLSNVVAWWLKKENIDAAEDAVSIIAIFATLAALAAFSATAFSVPAFAVPTSTIIFAGVTTLNAFFSFLTIDDFLTIDSGKLYIISSALFYVSVAIAIFI